MTFVALGRVVSLVTQKASDRQFRIGLEAVEPQTGRIVCDPVTDYEGDGTIFDRGDVLFGKLRPYLGKVWMAVTDGAAIGDFHVYRPDPARLAGEYLRYCLLARTFLDPVASSVFGAKMPRANWDFIRNVEIYLPPIHEQRSIADYLDRETAQIDTLIDEQQRLTELLRERRGAVVAQHFHGHAGKRQTTVKRVLRPISRPALPGAGVVTAYRDGVVTLRSNRRDDGYTFSDTEHGYQGIRTGDLVFHALDGFAGAVGISDSNGNATPVYHVCEAADGDDLTYVAMLLRYLGVSGHLATQAPSTRQRSVDFRNWSTFGRVPLSLPPLDRQRTVVVEVAEQTTMIDTLIAETERFIDLARERRSALITSAVTGQIDVRGEFA